MDVSDYQAGAYELQYSNKSYKYESFTPSKINRPWEISDSDIQNLLSKADRALGELNAFSQLIPNVDFFIRMHVAKEATQSSRIEGTRTNMEEVLLAEEDIAPEKRDDWEEVQNYILATNIAINRLKNIPLSARLLKDTHKILMSGVRGEKKNPGEFRTAQNWIGVSLEQAVFIPPHQKEVLELMSDLQKFLHDEKANIPHLVRIAVAHYQFETIHPFNDGNGRLGRLMIALYFAGFGLLHKPALYLSDYFERNKTSYVDHLMAVRQADKMKEWIIFFLYGVLETAQNSIKVFKDILVLKERLEREVLPHFSTRRQGNAQALMRALYQSPGLDIKAVSSRLDLTTNTATALVNDFVKYGVLEEMTGKRRNRIFWFREYITIFS